MVRMILCENRDRRNPDFTQATQKARDTFWTFSLVDAMMEANERKAAKNMKLGTNLQYLRRLHGNMTQERLAERMGVSRQTVSKWETGVSQT